MEKDKILYRSLDNLEVREMPKNEDESLIIEGYIAKFDTETELFDGYFEKIDRSAFDDTLADGHNVFLIYHHNYENILASTRNNTLVLTKDDIGLRFKANINPNLSYGRDVYELISSGEIRGCSFGFRIEDESYDYDYEKDELHSTLKRVGLYEGTITPIPAYENTEVYAREKNIREEERKKIEIDKELEELKIDLELMELENELM